MKTKTKSKAVAIWQPFIQYGTIEGGIVPTPVMIIVVKNTGWLFGLN